MTGVLINTIVLTIIIAVILRGEDRPDTSGLLTLPLGLNILALVSALLIGKVPFIGELHWILVFVVSVSLLRWIFDITLKQSLLVGGIWMGWMLLYPYLAELL